METLKCKVGLHKLLPPLITRQTRHATYNLREWVFYLYSYRCKYCDYEVRDWKSEGEKKFEEQYGKEEQ